MKGATMASMLQYIVDVEFSMVVGMCLTLSYCIFEEFRSRMRYSSFKHLSPVLKNCIIKTFIKESWCVIF